MKKIILVAGLIAASGALIAEELVLDYEFADGEIASGAEVNANFQALEGKANEHDVDATYNNAVLGSGLTNLQYSIVDCTQELGQYKWLRRRAAHEVIARRLQSKPQESGCRVPGMHGQCEGQFLPCLQSGSYGS